MRKSFVGFAAAAVVFAGASGCSEKVIVIQRAYVDALMKAGSNPTQNCQVASGPFLRVGESVDKPVNDGDAYEGGGVSVQCAVIPSGDAFDVNATLQLKGAGEKNGSITIAGRLTPNGRQENIRATFANQSYGTWTQSNCTIDYQAGTLQSVAAGRVWGFLTCPTITLESQGRICEGTSELKFENCTQTAAKE